MNFVDEINAFERWLETNHLPANAQLLWYKLFMLNNRAGWVDWIQVDNQRLMSLVQAGSDHTFIRARDKLIEAGLVSFRKGKKGSPNRYHLHSLCGNTAKNAVETSVYPAVETAVEASVYPADIYKLNETKKDILSDIQKESEWFDFVEMRKKIKKPMTDRAVKMALSKLEELAPGNPDLQKQILNQSTYHCWQGLFALKETGGISGGNAQDEISRLYGG